MIFRRKVLTLTQTEWLKRYVHDIVGHLFAVYKKLPCGLPEYIYQEALDREFVEANLMFEKEFIYHPVYNGEQLKSFFRMDFMIERSHGNIIIECKAIEYLGERERHQLFSYMIGTQFPIEILVNFATYPKVQIEKYFFDKKDGTITPF